MTSDRFEDRGTGRTYAQLNVLPAGSAFVVRHAGHGAYCRGLLREMGRDPQEVEMVPLGQARKRLTGLFTTGLGVDHAVVNDHGLTAQEADDLLWVVTMVDKRRNEGRRFHERRQAAPISGDMLHRILSNAQPPIHPGPWKPAAWEALGTGVILVLIVVIWLVWGAGGSLFQ